jgi:phytoene desaturase
MNTSEKTAIVIGSGIAGIAISIRLALKGYKTIVYEKNSYPGGKLSHFSLGDYQFDAGPSLFTQPENIKALFDLAGEEMESYFTYTPQPLACKYFFEDGEVLNAYTNPVDFVQELHTVLKEDKKVINDYLNSAEALYNNVGEIFLNNSIHSTSFLSKINWKKTLNSVRWKHLFHSMNRVNSSIFKNKKTTQLFNRYATYNGSNPYKAPAMLNMIAHLEHSQGTYYPKGGMISITNALVELAEKKGVKFFYNKKVDSIIKNGNQVVGVQIDGEQHLSSIVVSNMDVYYTYQNLLQQTKQAKKIIKQERSSSALIFYWGIKKVFPELSLHNILFSKNYKEEFDHLFSNTDIYEDPTIYINITSKCEPGIQAPLNSENWFVMVNAPIHKGQDWSAQVDRIRNIIMAKIDRMLGTSLKDYIEVESVLTPPMIETKTSSFQGSLYGTSSNTKWAAFLRHPNYNHQFKNLYFVGGSVHPGGGIPLCLRSAAITSELISKNYEH